jgi:rhodanese-related sulfurtransferase
MVLAVGLSLSLLLSADRVRGEQTVQNNDGTAFVVLTPHEAKDLIEKRDGLQLVDVRTEREFYGGALPGSRLVTWSSWSPQSFLQKMQIFDKKKPLLLVCAVGGRSFAAAALLSQNGFREVYNLDKGLTAWVQQRVPLPSRVPGSSP